MTAAASQGQGSEYTENERERGKPYTMTSEEGALEAEGEEHFEHNPVTPIGRRGLFPAQLFLPFN